MSGTQMKACALAAAFVCSVACHKAVTISGPAPRSVPIAPSQVVSQASPLKTAVAITPSERIIQVAPRPSEMSAQERQTLEERLAHLEDVLFDYDRYTVRADAVTILKDDINVVRGILANYPQQTLRIEGHADQRGSEEYNMALGDKRARAVEDFLAMSGIPSRQLTVISFGKERPICRAQSEECWQKNRRAHITAAR